MPLLIEQIASTPVIPAGNLNDPRAIVLSDGRILAWWTRNTVYEGQLLTADGVKIGGLLSLGPTPSNAHTSPAIVALPGGGFAAAAEVTGTALDIALRIYSSTGQLLSTTPVNDVVSTEQDTPAITRLASGNLVVVWRDNSSIGDPIPFSVKMKIFDASGVALTSETLVNTTTQGWQYWPSVATLQNGNFVVSWLDDHLGKMFQLYDASGARIGGETHAGGGGATTSVVALSNGNFELAGNIYDGQGQLVASSVAGTGAPHAIDGGFLIDSALYDNNGVAQPALPSASVIGSGGATLLGLDNARNLIIYREDDGIGGQIVPSVASVSETAPENAPALTLATASAALNSTFTYSYVSDSAGGAFRVEGNDLVVADASKLDFETAPTINVTLRSTDLNGAQYTTTFSLNIADQQLEYRIVAGPEAQYTAGLHHDPQFTTLTNGNVVELFATGDAVNGQLFDASMNPIGGIFPVNVPVGQSPQMQPEAIALPGGGFAAIWSSPFDLFARFFDASGSPTGPDFMVPTDILYPERFGDVALLSGGNLIVTWWDQINGLQGQILSPTGAKIGGEIAINSFPGSLHSPHVVALSTGGFMVTWGNTSGTGTPPESRGIRAQLFDANGGKVGSEFSVQTLVTDSNHFVAEPRLATLQNGDIITIWTQVEPGPGSARTQSIHMRRFDSTGALIGPDISLHSGLYISDTTFDIAEVVALDSGGFALMWKSLDPANNGIAASDRLYAQAFAADGTPLDSPFMVSSDDGIAILSWHGEVLASGDLLLSWEETSSLSSPEGVIKSRILDLSGGEATAGNDHIAGTADSDLIYARDGNDQLDLSQGGNDQVYGGAGDDGFFFGAAFTAADHVDGGAGANDQIGLQGNYAGANALTLGASTITGIEAIVVLPGFSYDITTVDANLAAGQVLKIQATQLAAGQSLTFDGSAETDGSFLVYGGQGDDNMTGGAGNDGFYFGPGGFNSSDTIDGGPGANDQLALDGDYTITMGGNVTGVEVLVLLPGPAGTPNTFNVTISDAFVAAGQTMTVFGLQVSTSIMIDGSGEHDGNLRLYGGSAPDTLIGGNGGSGTNWFFGSGGGDALTSGTGVDTFYYDDAGQSTSLTFDRIVGFDEAVDKIDLPFAVTGLAGPASGDLSTASFDSDLSTAFAGLTSHQAGMFTATGGDMAGHSFLVVDADGVQGYQAGSDYVIEIVSPVTPVDNPAIFV